MTNILICWIERDRGSSAGMSRRFFSALDLAFMPGIRAAADLLSAAL
jgi:hypothetical protein